MATNREVISIFHDEILTGTLDITLSRRDIIEATILGTLILPELILPFDLFTGNKSLTIRLNKVNGELTSRKFIFNKH